MIDRRKGSASHEDCHQLKHNGQEEHGTDLFVIRPVQFSKRRVSAERSFGRSFCFGGGSWGRSFGGSFRACFWRIFRACFVGTFRAEKTSAKTSPQNSHDSAQQSWRKFRVKTS